MENLKIRVNSESESKEAQQLFFELGYEKGVCSTGGYPALIIATPESRFQKTPYSSRATSLNHEAHSQYKEITLPELSDLVVLKRNNRNDRTHTDQDNWSWFISSNGTGYVFGAGNANGLHQWDESSLNMVDLKPIEKKEMKEYLDKQQDGTYKLIEADSGCVDRDWIEIPEGAEIYIDLGFRNHSFYKDNFKLCWCGVRWENTVHNSMNLEHWNNTPVLWKRHTHPEELPFIDDEPLLQTEIESELDQVENLRELLTPYTPPLNDQYAEIEKVRQTLNQRQEQYGSFEDVAMITEQMVDVMRKGYYENLAYNQKMALYMICSKMARIVNGNPNHKDSWHDIAGYATLIDNELVSEKDMPF